MFLALGCARVAEEFHWKKTWSLCSQAAKIHYITQQYIHAINTLFFFFALIHPYLPQQITELRAQIHAAIKNDRNFSQIIKICHVVTTFIFSIYFSPFCALLYALQGPQGMGRGYCFEKYKGFLIKGYKINLLHRAWKHIIWQLYFTEQTQHTWPNSSCWSPDPGHLFSRLGHLFCNQRMWIW